MSSFDTGQPLYNQGSHGLEFGAALRFPATSPEWMKNVAFGAICLLSTSVIPVLGQLIWLGYAFEIVETLHTQPKGQRSYPDFTFDRFSEYMIRGLWLFLVGLILSIVIVPVVGGVILAGFLGSVLIGGAIGDEPGAAIAIVIIASTVILTLALYIVMALLMTPFFLRAGLTQDLGKSFDFAFAKDFVAKVWKEMIVGGLFLIVVMIGAELIGLLACFVGIFPAVAWAMLVQMHLLWQLYELYLARGGEPVPLKPTAPRKPPIAPQA